MAPGRVGQPPGRLCQGAHRAAVDLAVRLGGEVVADDRQQGGPRAGVHRLPHGEAQLPQGGAEVVGRRQVDPPGEDQLTLRGVVPQGGDHDDEAALQAVAEQVGQDRQQLTCAGEPQVRVLRRRGGARGLGGARGIDGARG